MLGTITTLFSGWQFKLVLVATLIFGAWAWHTKEVSTAVSQAEQRVELQYAREIFKLKEQAEKESKELNKRINEINYDKQTKLNYITTKYNDLVVSLQHRKDRPSSESSNPGNTSNAESTEGATGLQLYKSDAIFLSWFSGQTARLQAELISCYKQYDEVRETLNNFKDKQNEDASRTP